LKKTLFLTVFLLFAGFSVFGEMVYVYIEETCNGEHVECLPQTRSGIFDELFEAGYIVFDNSEDKAETDRIMGKKLSPVFTQAVSGGADFLIAVAIASTREVLASKRIRLVSTSTYFLYDALTGKLLATGNATINNKDREEEMPPAQCGISMGKQIGSALGGILGSY